MRGDFTSSSSEEKVRYFARACANTDYFGGTVIGFAGFDYLFGEKSSLGEVILVGENVTLFCALVLGEVIP